MRFRTLFYTSAAVCASYLPAHALSWSVQLNCSSDYYAYCSMHVAGSAGCHACMRTNRSKLSNSCVVALIDDGILPKTDASQQTARRLIAKERAPGLPQSTAPVKVARKATALRIAAMRESAKSQSPDRQAAPSKRKFAALRKAEKAQSQKPTATALAIDQQTFEAFKNRAPQFIPAPEDETASIAGPN